MTKIKGYIPTMFMAATILFGATAANAGIIVGDRNGATGDTNPCEEPTTESTLLSYVESAAVFLKTGIIVGDRAGIIVGDRSGIIVGDRTASSEDTCGIIVGD